MWQSSEIVVVSAIVANHQQLPLSLTGPTVIRPTPIVVIFSNSCKMGDIPDRYATGLPHSPLLWVSLADFTLEGVYGGAGSQEAEPPSDP